VHEAVIACSPQPSLSIFPAPCAWVKDNSVLLPANLLPFPTPKRPACRNTQRLCVRSSALQAATRTTSTPLQWERLRRPQPNLLCPGPPKVYSNQPRRRTCLPFCIYRHLSVIQPTWVAGRTAWWLLRSDHIHTPALTCRLISGSMASHSIARNDLPPPAVIVVVLARGEDILYPTTHSHTGSSLARSTASSSPGQVFCSLLRASYLSPWRRDQHTIRHSHWHKQVQNVPRHSLAGKSTAPFPDNRGLLLHACAPSQTLLST